MGITVIMDGTFFYYFSIVIKKIKIQRKRLTKHNFSGIFIKREYE